MHLGSSYHIYNHAIGSENLFRNQENFRYFLELCGKYLNGIFTISAYCLLPNHFHMLIRIKDFEKLRILEIFKGTQSKEEIELRVSKILSNLFNAYTKAFNNSYKRKGSLFIKNFKRIEISSNDQWVKTFLYINLNAVKHKFVDDPQKWKWCSIHAYYNPKKPTSLNRDEALDYLDSYDNITYCLETRKNEILHLDFE